MCRMMFYENDGNYMRILSFVVNSNFRGNGFGSLLLKESEKLADKLNCKVITLNSGIRTEKKMHISFIKLMGLKVNLMGFQKYQLMKFHIDARIATTLLYHLLIYDNR